LQTLLFAKAEEVARAVGLVRRRRRLGGAQWVRTLVFGWMRQPDATPEDLADEAARLGAAITPRGLGGRAATRKVRRLRRLLSELVEALDDRAALEAVPRRIREELHRLCPHNRRKKKPGTIELLNEPWRARLGVS